MDKTPLRPGFYVSPKLSSEGSTKPSSKISKEPIAEEIGPEMNQKVVSESGHIAPYLSILSFGRGSKNHAPEDTELHKEHHPPLRSFEEELQKEINENGKLKWKVESLQKELGEEREKAQRYRRAANTMQTHMDNKELFLPAQLTDESIKMDIEGLMDSIRTWSFNQGEDTSKEASEADEQTLFEYQRVAPWVQSTNDIDHIRNKKRMRKFFLRGWVALVISDMIFRDAPVRGFAFGKGHDYWTVPRVSKSFNTLEDYIYLHGSTLSHRERNDWRALTVDLLTKIVEENQARNVESENKASIIPKEYMSDVLARLPIWVDKTARDDLYSILTEAVTISQALRRQRACWSVRFPIVEVRQVGEKRFRFPVSFDVKTMKAEYGKDDLTEPTTPGHFLGFVLTPIVYKRGNVQGTNFEEEAIKMQASVVLKEPSLG